MSEIRKIGSKFKPSKGVIYFFKNRKTEINKFVSELNLAIYPINFTELFVSQLILDYGLLKKRRKSVTINSFLDVYARVIENYMEGEMSPIQTIQLAKRIHNGVGSKTFHQLVNKYKESAEDHLGGLFLESSQVAESNQDILV